MALVSADSFREVKIIPLDSLVRRHCAKPPSVVCNVGHDITVKKQSKKQ
jgi:hypothetical protein